MHASDVMKFLWISPFACFIAGYLSMSLLHTNKTFKAPSLVGQPINQALRIASEANVNIRVIGQREDAELPEGLILHQTPAQGTPIKENQALYITISHKPEPSKVPSFCDASLTHIMPQYHNSNFILCPYYLASTMPHDRILAQYPAPGNGAADKKIIVYVADSYIKPVLMPNLKNRSVPEVTTFLTLHGITPHVIHRENRPAHTCDSCIITDQRPLPGSLITINPNKPLLIQLQVA